MKPGPDGRNNSLDFSDHHSASSSQQPLPRCSAISTETLNKSLGGIIMFHLSGQKPYL